MKNFLKKMGVTKQDIKDRKSKRPKGEVFKTSYGKSYYDNKTNGGIEYNPVIKNNIDVCENKTTIDEINRKNNIGAAMIDAQYGTPRDLGYEEKTLPKRMKL